ncbi:MAG: 2'-5' RNA ligase family protein [Sphingobacteriales bacterium]|nr:2'-5' RNA ligase family protein [Sphingobacteriales bacterium]
MKRLLKNPSASHSMYFIAILCPPATDEKIFQCKQWMKEQFGCTVALKSPAHITLLPPFWLEEEREGGLIATFQHFRPDLQEIIINLSGFSHFSKRVLYVGVMANPALEEIKLQTENYFSENFPGTIKKENRPFHPHVTIATRDMRPSDFDKAFIHFSRKGFAEQFQAKTISLLKLSTGRWNVITEQIWC